MISDIRVRSSQRPEEAVNFVLGLAQEAGLDRAGEEVDQVHLADDALERAGADYAAQPSAFVLDWLPRLPRGRALDVACGLGATAIALAEAGFDVTAIDIAPTALQVPLRRCSAQSWRSPRRRRSPAPGRPARWPAIAPR